jgi:hypothetical protein
MSAAARSALRLAKQATRELWLALLNSVFNGEGAGMQKWPGQFAAIVARFTRPMP